MITCWRFTREYSKFSSFHITRKIINILMISKYITQLKYLLKYIASLWHIMFTDVMQKVSGTKSMTVLSGRSVHDTAMLAQIQVRFHFACLLKEIVQQTIIHTNTMSCHSKPNQYDLSFFKKRNFSLFLTVFGQLKNRRLSLLQKT